MPDNQDREPTLWAETKDTLRLTGTLLLQAWLLIVGLVIEMSIEYARNHWPHLSSTLFFIAEGVTAGAFVAVYSYKIITHALKMMRQPGWPKRVAVLLGVLVPVSGLLVPVSGMFPVKFMTWRADTSGSLVLMGSDNVRSVIWSRVESLNPIWVDIGSGPGSQNIFQAFYYGRNTPLRETRFGLSALSSNGVVALLKEIDAAKNDEDELASNYFLNLRVAKVPLVFLYRGGTQDGLPETLTAEQVPRATQLQITRYVLRSKLEEFFRGTSGGGATRYIPEPESGTRKLFGSNDEFHWTNTNTRHYESCLEHFPSTFGELVTAAPFLCSPKERASRCGDLNPKQIFAAAVCLNADCTQLRMAEFSVVIKVEKLDDKRYRITNPSERQLAHLLSEGKINENGLVFPGSAGVSEEKDHILSMDTPIPISEVSEYLTCLPDKQ
jgi:hypothetical protein